MQATHERWLPVPGYEGLYEVSDLGAVRGPRTGDGRLKPRPHKDGYAKVNLCRGGRQKTFLVHRLVLDAFVGPREPGQECRHLDGDPSNNRLTNLAWGTQSENELDKVRHGTHNEAVKVACPQGHSYVCRTCQRAARRRS